MPKAYKYPQLSSPFQARPGIPHADYITVKIMPSPPSTPARLGKMPVKVSPLASGFSQRMTSPPPPSHAHDHASLRIFVYLSSIK